LRGVLGMSETFIKITNKDIYQKLIDIEEHVKLTNGRVTKNESLIASLEKNSLGAKIVKNPYKSILFFVTLFSILISDIRQPALSLLISFFV